MNDIKKAFEAARETLLAARTSEGFWEGRLSSSALATATAVSALSLVSRERFTGLIASAVRWLVEHANPDGGWGDTTDSPSNLATTMLVQAALALSQDAGAAAETMKRTETFLGRMAGTSLVQRVESLRESYGADRTFVTPILANCALAGLVRWRDVPALPFELARLPREWLRRLRLHVVSYALPALIAIGQIVHLRNRTGNPVLGLLRDACVASTLKLLADIQPRSGGFLEATPLTSFVVMSLAAAGRREHDVTRRGVDFLTRSVREDGSWPIDTNLATWVTTQAVEALGQDLPESGGLRGWLIEQQHRAVHPYTDARPGGWAWTDLSGGVPDADDTSGALVALSHLAGDVPADAVRAGLRWLLGLQNRDGGWPTFCRGWGRLPFDRSAPDLTAHAIRAITRWFGIIDARRERLAVRRGVMYLVRTQAPDGSWTPLWFGNQHTSDQTNPAYGTARVLAALAELGLGASAQAARGAAFLVRVQNPDGGWGGAKTTESTVEETALAVRALADLARDAGPWEACLKGAAWLAQRIEQNGLAKPAPIGLYFSRLWYSERLYPGIWSVAALRAVLGRAASKGPS